MSKEEKPEKILNKKIVLKDIEAAPNGLMPDLNIEAAVKSFEDGRYNIKFLSPVEINGNEEKSAWISSRVVGSPISNAKKNEFMAVSVNGQFGSGETFLAQIVLK